MPQLPLPPQLSTDPLVNASAMAWAAQLVDALQRGGGPWVEVGVTGAPAFTNSWVNFDATRKARFYKDAAGVVHLGGVIKSGTIGTTAFTLPAGYRPAYADTSAGLGFAVDSNAAHGRVHILGDGQVRPDVGNTAFVFLDGITFRAS